MKPVGRALVVGNTDGIGLALTKRLIGEGWEVVGVSRRGSSFTASGYQRVVVDVTDPNYRSVLGSVQSTCEIFDAVIYCAGIGELFDAQKIEDEPGVFRVNLLGAVDTIAVVLPAMLAVGHGHIVGLSSIGDGISASAPSYAASKAGLSSYLGGLALALRPRRIHVTNIRLGFVDTKMAKSRVRPFLISVERATDVVMRCLRRRPAQLTYPKRMGAIIWLLGGLTSLKLWLSRG